MHRCRDQQSATMKRETGKTTMSKGGLVAEVKFDGLEVALGKSGGGRLSNTQMELYGSVTSMMPELESAGTNPGTGNRTTAFFCGIEFCDRAKANVPHEIEDVTVGYLEVGSSFTMRIVLPPSDLSSLMAIVNYPIRVEPIFHRTKDRQLFTDNTSCFYIERVYFTPLFEAA